MEQAGKSSPPELRAPDGLPKGGVSTPVESQLLDIAIGHRAIVEPDLDSAWGGRSNAGRRLRSERPGDPKVVTRSPLATLGSQKGFANKGGAISLISISSKSVNDDDNTGLIPWAKTMFDYFIPVG